MENQSFSNQNNNEWYQKGWLVHLLLVFFFPVGLYALWKNSKLPKWWKITATIIIAVIFISVIVNKEKEGKKSIAKTEGVMTNITTKETKEEKSKEIEKPKESEKTIESGKPKVIEESKIILPASQVKFIEKVEFFYSLYREAPNELKKSALRTQRKQVISNLLSNRKVSGWIGTLEDMQTNSEGKAFIEIKLEGAKSITIKTWNNLLSDVFDNTLIENGTELYNAISNLTEGDLIIFNGTFISDDSDYIKEASITERGSMTDPEFIMKFTNVKKK